jgi:hypothetical protein
MNQTIKRDTIIYWLATGAVCALMAFSAVNFNSHTWDIPAISGPN